LELHSQVGSSDVGDHRVTWMYNLPSTEESAAESFAAILFLSSLRLNHAD